MAESIDWVEVLKIVVLVVTIGITVFLAFKKSRDEIRKLILEIGEKFRLHRKTLRDEKLLLKRMEFYEEIIDNANNAISAIQKINQLKESKVDKNKTDNIRELIDKQMVCTSKLTLYEKESDFLIRITKAIELEYFLLEQYNDELRKTILQEWLNIQNEMRKKLDFEVVDTSKLTE